MISQDAPWDSFGRLLWTFGTSKQYHWKDFGEKKLPREDQNRENVNSWKSLKNLDFLMISMVFEGPEGLFFIFFENVVNN